MADQPFYAKVDGNEGAERPPTRTAPPIPKPRRTLADSSLPELPEKKRPSSTSSSTGVHHSYDEVKLNFGRPVVVLKEPGTERASDIFDSITFQSPIRNTPPLPAPRFSKVNNNTNTNRYEDIDAICSDENRPVLDTQYSDPHDVNPPSPEGIYTEIEEDAEEDDVLAKLEELGTLPRAESLAKADTIGMRNIFTAWYDEATEEMERDLSLNLDDLERSRSRGSGGHNYEHVALSEPNSCTFVGGKLVVQTKTDENKSETLLRNFDPLVIQGENIPEVYGATALPAPSTEEASEDEEEAKDQIFLNENLYVAFPAPKQETNLIDNDRDSVIDLPPPLTAPPPLPSMEPPPVPKRLPSAAYENVWVGPSSNGSSEVRLEDTPDQTLRSRASIVLTSKSSDDFDDSSFSSASLKSQEETKKSPWGHLTEELKRKVSLPSGNNFKGSNNSLIVSRSASKEGIEATGGQRDDGDRGTLLQRRSSYLHDGRKSHSGVLYSQGGNSKKKHFNPKWCVLGNGTFTYFDDKYSLAIPKEQIPISDILSVTKMSGGDNNNGWLFDIGFAVGKTQLGLFSRGYYGTNHCVRTFVAMQESDRDLWVEKIVQNLSRSLGNFSLLSLSSAYIRFTWVHMKTGFAGEWATNWVVVNDGYDGRRRISYLDHMEWVHLDLKKIKTLSLVKDVKNLQAPFQYPVIVIDAIDRSLYLMVTKERECTTLKEMVESWTFDNGNDLSDQQLNQDNVPVVVEECIKFVYGHGCMTEGIYRLAGVNTKIEQLLNSFRRNAWNVKVNREVYSEHDAANCLKRYCISSHIHFTPCFIYRFTKHTGLLATQPVFLLQQGP